MQMWQRLDSLKISWDFWVLGRVTRNRGKVTGYGWTDERKTSV
jgi:hypothetical protein